jgi:hypothetical protein
MKFHICILYDNMITGEKASDAHNDNFWWLDLL